MTKYYALKQYFELTLALVVFLKAKTKILEEQAVKIRNTTEGGDIYETFMSILNEIKKNTKYLEKKLSELAFKITSEDKELIEILDEVYLNKKKAEKMFDDL